eukprot:GHRQ01035995.1.p2 GENE.GHRQ01035995.1~~GHRQ01035995.1.p2  ORF type:complete len:105 (-),score=19.84 GHRQ01035995.1:130-444(-)
MSNTTSCALLFLSKSAQLTVVEFGSSGTHLCCICVKEHLALSAQCTDLSQWLPNTDLVVDRHDGHQCSVRPQRISQLAQVNAPIFANRQVGDVPAALLQIAAAW